jgi:phage terminase large subunit
LLVETHFRFPGTRSVCIRENQKSLKESSKHLIESKIQSLDLGPYFNPLHDRVETPGGGTILFQGMQDHTAETIKSLEGCRVAWVEEGQALSERSLSLLRPTIRWENKATGETSELWFSWNPTRKKDAVDVFAKLMSGSNEACFLEANWRDNPWFPDVLEAERQTDLRLYPDRYDHIWEGGYAKAFEGAYFAAGLAQAKAQGRICRVGEDPILPVRAYFDIGGASRKSDATSIWIVQFVGREIRILDYIEGIGQTLGYYIAELRKRGYGQALCRLPHDGVTTNNITGKRYRDHLADAEFDVDTIKNQGVGAAAMRIEAVRRILPRCWFNEATTEAGRDALGYYHEHKDETRNIGLGPDHDWSSHAADAFGYMAIDYEEPRSGKPGGGPRRTPPPSPGSHWSA